jgi:polyvinyl alcohol dehydrogenase (cytochrome)
VRVNPLAGRRRPTAAAAVLGLATAFVVGTAPLAGADSSTSSWPMFGQNLNNTANASTVISPSNVATLKPKWTFTTGGDVSARAAVVGGRAYFPDWSGHLYSVNAGSGKLVWSKNILTDYLNGVFDPAPAKVVSRTSPFLDTKTNTLYVGTQAGAYLLAIDALTGNLKWRTQLDDHPLAIDTASPVVFKGNVYVGVASLEEAAATDPSYPCCSFRGSVMSLDAATGQVNWKTFMVPVHYNGGAVWGSTIVPDPARGLVYATTGNNYYPPQGDATYDACIANGGTAETCNSLDDHFDAVLALRMNTGQIAWVDRFATADDWNVACFFSGINCPVNAGPDFDFGSGVQLMTVQTNSGPKQILGAGQKSGVYSAIDPSTGQVVWATQVGPGSSLGGMEWGSATDGTRIYVQNANLYGIPHTLPDGTVNSAGSWAALNPATGQIIWQVADPHGAIDIGPMTVANGVVYAPSMAKGATDTTMFALNAATGSTLWSFAAGSSVNAGAVVAKDTVYWGSGYGNLGPGLGSSNNKFYAFTLGGR